MTGRQPKLRPKLQPDLTARQFSEKIAGFAFELDRWIGLSVVAFSSDPQERNERIKKTHNKTTGFCFFVETYLPHYVKADGSRFHDEIFQLVPKTLFNKKGGSREVLVAHMGASKTTHVTLAANIYCVVMGLKHYSMIISDVYSQAVLMVEAIKAELTSNPRIRNDFPECCGEGKIWREGEIITKNNIRIEGLGAGQKIRGRRHGPFRPDLVIMDDLENDENVRSPYQRDKLEKWIDGAVLEVGPPDGSLDVFYVGSVLHFDAVLARKAKSPTWHVTRFPAIIIWPSRMDLWDRFEEIFHNDGPLQAKGFYTKHKKVMDKGAIINWPTMQPLVFLMLKRASSHGAFAAEYQNQPIAENNPFGDITYWIKRKPDLVCFGAIDPSLGKRGKGRDPSAILIGGIDRISGDMDVLEASIRKRLPDIIISDAIGLQREYNCVLWFIEAIQFQEFLQTSLMREAVKQGVALPTIPIKPHTDKNLRIERLQPPIKSGLIRLNPTQTTLIDQLQQWPNGDHDDGPDCLDMLWQNAVKYSGKSGLVGSGILTSGSSVSDSALEGYRL